MKAASARLLVVFTALGLTAGQLVMRFPLLMSRRFDPDELEHMHVAWSIFTGQVPFRDFFEHHTPFFHYLLALFLYMCDVERSPEKALSTLFAARYVTWLLGICILGTTFLLARQLRGLVTAWVSLPLAASSIVIALRGIEIRPDGLSTVLWLGSLVAFHTGLSSKPATRRSRFHFIVSGIAIALGVLTSQKLLLAGPSIVLLMGWYVADSAFGGTRRQRVTNVLWQAAGTLITWAIAVGYFILNGAVVEFLRLTLIDSVRWKTETIAATILTFIMRYEPWLFALTAGGAVVLAWECHKRDARRVANIFLLVSAASLFAGLFVVPVPYAQYCLTFVPLFAIVSASLLVEVTRKLSSVPLADLVTRPSLWAVLILVSVSTFAWLGLRVARPMVFIPHLYSVLVAVGTLSFILLSLYRRSELAISVVLVILSTLPVQWSRWMLELGDNGQFSQLRYVMEHTDRNGVVLDGWSGLGVFRQHAGYYWFLHPGVRAMLSPSEVDHFVQEFLSKRVEPEVVVLDEHLQQFSPHLVAFVKANYTAAGVGDIYIRGQH